MQPSRDPANWQQPNEQPSQAPYVATHEETPAPVVTMMPDQPQQTIASPTPPDVSSERAASVDNSDAQQAEPIDETLVRWQATEYIHREKNPIWYIVFILVTIGLMGLALFMKEYTFAVLVPVMAVALYVYTRRPPHIIDYTLSRQGLHVGDHLYPFVEFKGFGVIHDDDEYSIMLIPTKRFKPGVSVYFPEESGEAIVDMLGARLPMQELHLDMVDRVIRKLRI